MTIIIYDLYDVATMEGAVSKAMDDGEWTDAENPFPAVKNCFYVIVNKTSNPARADSPAFSSTASSSSGSGSATESLLRSTHIALKTPKPSGAISAREIGEERSAYQRNFVKTASKGEDNSYIGIAGNSLQKRFKSRCEAVVHLGIGSAYMSNVTVWWGRAYVFKDRDSGSSGVESKNKIKIYGRGEGNLPSKAKLGDEIKYSSRTRVVEIDGKKKNLEHLLIRLYVAGTGVPATNTNTIYARKPFINDTESDMLVWVRYCVATDYPAGRHEVTIASGENL